MQSRQQETMTARARAYIGVTVAQHGAAGAAMTLLPEQFDGDGFRVARDLFPIWVWGLVFLAGAGWLARAAVRGEEDPARTALVLSIGLTGLFAGQFVASYSEGGIVSPVGAIFCVSLMAKDLVQAAQPMRSPFERVAKEYDRDTDEA